MIITQNPTEKRKNEDQIISLLAVETEPLWTVDEVAQYLRLTPETVRVMARKGELPSIKVGKRTRRFKINDIKNWLGIHMEGNT